MLLRECIAFVLWFGAVVVAVVVEVNGRGGGD